MNRRGRKNILKDIRRHAFYNACLLATIVLLSAMLLSGTVVSGSLRTGMGNMQKRLGADIMLVPKGSKEKAENMLLEGSRSTFYFDASIYEKVAAVDGISEITSQCFLKSLSADCCSSEVEIVFFDPQSDFVVAPWIETEYRKDLSGNQVVVGNSISSEDGKIKLFGQEYPVVSKMAKTGTALDSSVYFTSEAMGEILENAEEKGSFLTEDQKNGGILSSIFINLKAGEKSEKVVESVHQVIGDIFDVVYPKQLHASLSGSLIKITGIVNIISFVLGGLLVLILLIINSILMNQRKQEVALFRVLGRTKRDLIRMLVSEMGLISISGAVIGCLLSAVIVIPFGAFIGRSLNMPYLGPGLAATMVSFALIVLGVFLIVFLASIFFIVHISSVDPYLAMRREE